MNKHSSYLCGFTLIEVLISMVILAIGLLGLAAMQTISLRDNQDAHYYQQATLLAYEMQDRIRANNNVNWSNVTAGAGDLCTQSIPCTATEMAANDYGYWKNMAKKILPISTTNPDVVSIQLSSNVNKGSCKGTYPTSLCLVTTWAKTNHKTAGISADATFYLEVTP